MIPLLQLTCANTAINKLVMFGICGLIIVGTTLVVLVYILHHSDHPEDALRRRETQALLHLWLPHDSRVPLLWDPFCHVCPAGSCGVRGAGQGGLCLLHSGHPDAESPHLQSEKQGREGCPAETGPKAHSHVKEGDWRDRMF